MQKDQNRGGTSLAPPHGSNTVTASNSGPQPSAAVRPTTPHQQQSTSRRGDFTDPSTNTPPDSNNTILCELRKMFAEFKVDLNTKLDLVISDLETVKSDIASMKSTMLDLEGSVADTSARIDTVESDKIPSIQRSLDQMKAEFEDKLIYQELHHRKQNLLLYGIPSQPNENVYMSAAKAFAQLLEVPVEEGASIPIVNTHRLPTKKPLTGASNAPSPPDPIIVRFARMSDRDRILRAFEQPRRPRDASGNPTAESRITVRTDLPPKMKRERGRLASVAYNLRKTKHLKTKIAIIGTKVVLQTKHPNEPSSNWSTWTE